MTRLRFVLAVLQVTVVAQFPVHDSEYVRATLLFLFDSPRAGSPSPGLIAAGSPVRAVMRNCH